MSKKYLLFVQIGIGTFLILLGGCSTGRNMACKKNMEKIDMQGESIALLTVRIVNNENNTFYVEPRSVYVGEMIPLKTKHKTYKYRFSIRRGNFNEMPHEYLYKKSWEPDPTVEYLISMRLPAGKYILQEIGGMTCANYQETDFGKAFASGMASDASFCIPVYSEIIIEPNEIVYVGNIEGVYRKREEKYELKAGPVVPLLQQALAGVQNCTFDVLITDKSEVDIPIFRDYYPALEKFIIKKRILPSWQRPNCKEVLDVMGR